MKNFKRTLQTALVLVSLIATVACSTQERTNNWEPDAVELGATLDSFFSTAGGSNNNGLVQTTRGEVLPETDAELAAAAAVPKNIYYAESGVTGLPLSVAGILDFSIFGLPTASLYNVAEAKVLLMDTFTAVNRQFTLIISVKFIEPDGSTSQFQTAAFQTGTFSFDESDKLTLSFENFDITSFDLSSDDDLNSVIQLNVFDKSGVDYGQFSSLVGFGN